MDRHIKGGQGRSDEDTEKTGYVLIWIAFSLASWLLVALIWRAING